jgi:hypothetical protein
MTLLRAVLRRHAAGSSSQQLSFIEVAPARLAGALVFRVQVEAATSADVSPTNETPTGVTAALVFELPVLRPSWGLRQLKRMMQSDALKLQLAATAGDADAAAATAQKQHAVQKVSVHYFSYYLKHASWCLATVSVPASKLRSAA